MRNLKKVLSLVLALAMVLSICMVGAGAANYDDFTDEESITKKQAVETLVSLDVINGYNDGAEFRPTGNVTRAEMATMICRVLAGGDNMIVDATKPVPTYTDIRNDPSAAWAESYIEYCTSLGIVSGKGNGIFDPSADVTAAEAAKMVMTTLGYNADIENFKGIGWDINVMAKANTLQLLDNLQGEISSSVPVTREQVAQLLYNALSSPVVQNYVGASANTWLSSGSDAYQQTLLETKFHARKIMGVVEANEWADLYAETPIRKGTTRLALMDSDGDLTGETEVYNVSTELLDIGQSVIVYWDTETKRVLYGDTQDTGTNVISEIKTGYSNITRGDDAVTGSLTKDTQYFVNYDNRSTVNGVSDYLIRYRADNITYVFTGANAETEAKDIVAEINEQVGANSPYGTTAVAAPVSVGNGAWSITYSIGAGTAPVRQIRPGSDITSLDLFNMNAIFSLADKQDTTKPTDTVTSYTENGAVYVGTQSVDDISDTMSYREFVRRYIDSNEEVMDRDDFAASNGAGDNENGNYIRTVDFNNDGDIDYVLKIEFGVDAVARIDRDGNADRFENLTVGSGDDANASSFVCDDELAVDDVIIYTVIDGIAYGVPADTFSAEVRTYSWRNDEITTTDGDVYGQSKVWNSDNGDLADYYYTDLEQASDKVTYDFYTDIFGYVAAFADNRTNDLVLLTDGYYTYGLNKKEAYRIEYYDRESGDFKTAQVDVDNSRSTSSIYDYESYRQNENAAPTNYNADATGNVWTGVDRDITSFISRDRNPELGSYQSEGWERLIGATQMVRPGGANTRFVDGADNNAWTNVAALSIGEDIVDVKDVNSKATRSETFILELLGSEENGNTHNDGDLNFASGARLLTGVDSTDIVNPIDGDAKITVLANSRTVYYYVYRDASSIRNDKNMVITERVGYQNSLKIDNVRVGSTWTVNAAYAVVSATQSYADNPGTGLAGRNEYPVADVVVIELNQRVNDVTETALTYYVPDRNSGSIRTLNAITAGAEKSYQLNIGAWDSNQYANLPYNPFGFYTMGLERANSTRADSAELISTNYNSYGIYAATIRAVNELGDFDDENDYVYLTNGRTLTVRNTTPLITFEGDRDAADRGAVRAVLDNKMDSSRSGHQIIYVMNRNNVSYIVDVTASAVGTIRDRLTTLWNEIDTKGAASPDTSKEDAIKAAEAALAGYRADPPTVTLDELKKAYDAIKDMTLDGLTTDQANRLGAVKAGIEAEIGGDACDYANALIEAYDAWKASNDGDKEKTAMFKAAVDYKPHNGQPSGTELGDKAYVLVVAEAAAEVKAYVDALTTLKFENLDKVDEFVVDDNAVTLAKTVTSGGVNVWNDSNYNTAVANWNRYKDAFAKAVTLVEAYIAYNGAGIDNSRETQALIDAYGAIEYTEHMLLSGLSDSGYQAPVGSSGWSFTGDGNTYYAAWEAADALYTTENAKGGFGDSVSINKTLVEKYGAEIDMSMFDTPSEETEGTPSVTFTERRIHLVVNSKAALGEIDINPITTAAFWLGVDLTADGTQVGGKDAYRIVGANHEGTGAVTIYPELIGNRYTTDDTGDFHDKAIVLDFYGEDTTIDERLILCFDYEAPAQKTFSAAITTASASGNVTITVTCENDGDDETGITSITLYRVGDNGTEVQITKITDAGMKAGTDKTYTVSGTIAATTIIRADVEMADGQILKTESVSVGT